MMQEAGIPCGKEGVNCDLEESPVMRMINEFDVDHDEG